MHRIILGITHSKIQGEHKDHNGLNNQRDNLRKATCSQNLFNSRKRKSKTTSSFKGVHFKMEKGKYPTWIASIKVGKTNYKHRFQHEISAALKYNELAIKYFGEFAEINKISEEQKLLVPSRIIRKSNRPIIQFDLRLNEIGRYDGATDAAKKLNISRESIKNNLRRGGTCNGFVFKYMCNMRGSDEERLSKEQVW